MIDIVLTPPRIYEEELLDAGVGTDDDVARNLSDLRRVNRWLGGTRVTLKALDREVSAAGLHQFTLLDVGTGSADIPQAILARYDQRKISATVFAADISERNLRVARVKLGTDPRIQMVQANALQLPFAPGSFDFVTASLFLHHFTDDDVIVLLRSFGRLARRAVVVNDLVRNLVPYYFARLTGPLLATSFMTRNDAPVSVLRGFTSAELMRMAGAASLRNVAITRVFPFRLMLVASMTG
jgi:ubiquinone/menaquinone biosynthesis C-methylase UbiE